LLGDGGGREARLRVQGLLASADGHTVIRLAREGDDPEEVGAEVARALLEGGGRAVEGFADVAAAVAGGTGGARGTGE
jgi:porphobilinogen deaminase